MGSAHDESRDAMVPQEKFKLPARAPASANAVLPSTGTACEVAGLRAGDIVRIGGRLKDARAFKFISAEWDHKTGECYAFVQAPGAFNPVRVLASGLAKISKI